MVDIIGYEKKYQTKIMVINQIVVRLTQYHLTKMRLAVLTRL